jgi:AraC family ethanolamine operon transcriptional activator
MRQDPAEPSAADRAGILAPAPLLMSSSTDVDEHCAGLGRWRLNYDQISSGAFQGSFTQLSLPHVDAFREVTSQQVRQYGRLGSGSFGIGLPWRDTGEVNCNGSSIAGCKAKAFELRGVIMSAALIESLMVAMNVELPRDVWHQLRALDIAPEPIRRIRHLLTMVQDTIDHAPWTFASAAARQHLEDSLLVEIVDMLPTARPCDDVRGGAARKRIVDRACDLMLSRLDDPLSILEVCRCVGASRRKLNYCFQEVLGASPISYLRAVRLNRVRRLLRQCEDDRSGVYDIAVRYGFWHFSQFSLDYKRHFAELPSETLRRARLARAPEFGRQEHPTAG